MIASYPYRRERCLPLSLVYCDQPYIKISFFILVNECRKYKAQTCILWSVNMRQCEFWPRNSEQQLIVFTYHCFYLSCCCSFVRSFSLCPPRITLPVTLYMCTAHHFQSPHVRQCHFGKCYAFIHSLPPQLLALWIHYILWGGQAMKWMNTCT
jgi:hypothetical protein